jgi:hypothetical protein
MDKIKKYLNGNKYLLTPQSKWARDFTRYSVPFIDINKTIKSEDHFLFLKNEFENRISRYPWIDSEKIYHPNIIIISDGFEFNKIQKIIEELPSNITIFAVNGALKKWQNSRNLNYYIINNPYEECIKFLPNTRKILPKCIASSRTNSKFLKNYNGAKFRYYSVNEKEYIGSDSKEVSWQVDDYRNPVCASIVLAYKFGVEKLLLLCCDDSFAEERPGSLKLENGLFTYPQHLIAHGLIDASLYWLKNQEFYNVKLGNCSCGPIYKNVERVDLDNIKSFFEDIKNERSF